MYFVKLILWPIASLAELFIVTKIVGNRQMSELNMFDYINGITIGSIAAEMATSLDEDIFAPMVAMAVYGLITIILSDISAKSIKARRIFVGKSIIVFQNDSLIKKNLKIAKLDINEFITQCREEGYFDLSQIDTAILESNGKISILPKTQYRPATPNDISLKPQQEKPQPSVIIDGSILEKNLKHIGKDIAWIEKELKSQKIGNISDVFYASFDSVSNKLNAFEYNPNKNSDDIFI